MAMTELEHAQKTIVRLEDLIETIATRQGLHIHCDQDPVECSHQALVGQLEELQRHDDQLGILYGEAMELLTQADIAIDSLLHHDADRAHNARMILDKIRGRR